MICMICAVIPLTAPILLFRGGETITVTDLRCCPSCEARRGPPEWCGQSYQSEAHAAKHAEAVLTWREGLAA